MAVNREGLFLTNKIMERDREERKDDSRYIRFIARNGQHVPFCLTFVVMVLFTKDEFLHLSSIADTTDATIVVIIHWN